MIFWNLLISHRICHVRATQPFDLFSLFFYLFIFFFYFFFFIYLFIYLFIYFFTFFFQKIVIYISCKLSPEVLIKSAFALYFLLRTVYPNARRPLWLSRMRVRLVIRRSRGRSPPRPAIFLMLDPGQVNYSLCLIREK